MTEMPTEVLMDFKGDIRLTRVAITHADKRTVWTWTLSDQTAFTQEFALPVHDMGAGVYSWLNGAGSAPMAMPLTAPSVSPLINDA